MELLAIIPARGGSKGVPRKNIKMLAGKPLIYYSIKAALDSKYVSRVVVSTEDKEIAEISLACGAEVVERPFELAKDETKTAPVVFDVLAQLVCKEGYCPDAIVLLQATSPLRDASRLDDTIETFLNNKENCDSVFTVKKIGTTHGKWRKNHDGTPMSLFDFRNRPRRQDVGEHYDLMVETGETYIVKTETFKSVGDLIGDSPVFHEVEEAFDIDTIEDFEIVEKQIIRRENK